MIHEISRDLIKSYLEQIDAAFDIDNDGDLFMILEADNDFAHDVIIYFLIKDNQLCVQSFANGFKIPEEKILDALIAINHYNSTTKYPKVYLRNNFIFLEQWFTLDEEVSEAYIKENCIKLMVPIIWKFFVDFKY